MTSAINRPDVGVRPSKSNVAGDLDITYPAPGDQVLLVPGGNITVLGFASPGMPIAVELYNRQTGATLRGNSIADPRRGNWTIQLAIPDLAKFPGNSVLNLTTYPPDDRLHSQLLHILASRPVQELRIFESYSGVVEDVDGGEVVVRYQVNGDVVEQTYERSQFQGEQLPNVGDRLVVDVYVTAAPKDVVDQKTIEEALAENDKPNVLRTPITGPTTF